MYLNLDLLYNIDKYLYPLFYYKYCNNDSGCKVYSPITKKSVYINYSYDFIYYDYITKKYKKYGNLSSTFEHIICIFTENILNHNGHIFNKCKPFKLNKEYLYFLKSIARIN